MPLSVRAPSSFATLPHPRHVLPQTDRCLNCDRVRPAGLRSRVQARHLWRQPWRCDSVHCNSERFPSTAPTSAARRMSDRSLRISVRVNPLGFRCRERVFEAPIAGRPEAKFAFQLFRPSAWHRNNALISMVAAPNTALFRLEELINNALILLEAGRDDILL